ncbi:MAG: phosphoribosylamine--glycine ligase [Candidatus Promineifilaceae bacterium]
MSILDILIVGSGGREHALAWKIAQSPQAGRIFVAPGNAGTAELATNVPIMAGALPELVQFAVDKAIDLVVVGPEAPLAAGLVDRCQEANIAAFGPSQSAARLESSKAFAKSFMIENAIPTADSQTFVELEPALDYLQVVSGPVVVKASGLAAGKGVIVCDDMPEAWGALRDMFVDRAFGAAADEVLVEERLSGPELSLLAFCDGRTAVPMLPARDHKRAYNDDQGPNTGGMGAFAPPEDASDSLVQEIMEQVINPVVQGMLAAGTPYKGVLYAGIMLTADGPRVLEFNCRFGDPETQVILPLLQGDLLQIMLACANGSLEPEMVRRRGGACATVVMAAPGYPASYPRGLPISGIENISDPEILVFHAGTARQDGRVLTNGGRVLAVSGLGDDLESAVNRAYAGVAQIDFEGAHFRSDIGRPSQSAEMK